MSESCVSKACRRQAQQKNSPSISSDLSEIDWLRQLACRCFPPASPKTTNTSRERLAFYLPNLESGGAETVTLRLAEAFKSRGYDVDLVVNEKKGVNVAAIPPDIRLVELGISSRRLAVAAVLCAFPQDMLILLRSRFWRRKAVAGIRFVPRLASYLKKEKPALLIANMWPCNLNAIWARALAISSCRVSLTERNTLSIKLSNERVGKKGNHTRPTDFYKLMGRLYDRADARIAVSLGVGDDLADKIEITRYAIDTIYNPVVFPQLFAHAQKTPNHPWFTEGTVPVLLSVGRLHAQKNYDHLIRAFAQIRSRRGARLVILGEGPQRASLEALIAELNLGQYVSMPGHTSNPFRYMRYASVFVLSSVVEGLGNVLIEAMACGTPVVSTDCPSGPHEILAGGEYGRLVPIDDVDALAEAMEQQIDQTTPSAKLMARANDFSVDKAVDAYQKIVDQALDRPEV